MPFLISIFDGFASFLSFLKNKSFQKSIERIKKATKDPHYFKNKGLQNQRRAQGSSQKYCSIYQLIRGKREESQQFRKQVSR